MKPYRVTVKVPYGPAELGDWRLFQGEALAHYENSVQVRFDEPIYGGAETVWVPIEQILTDEQQSGR